MTTEGHSTTSRPWVAMGILLAYLALAVVQFWSAWSGPPNTYIGVAGDAQTHMWFLAWVPFALGHGHDPLVTTYLGYPRGVNVMWNNVDAFPVTSILLYPVTRLLGIVVTYNIVSTAALALSAWTAYFACRRFFDDRAGAFLGGALYGFSPYMAAQSIGHTGFTFAFVPPLILLAGHEILIRRRLRPLLVGALGGLLLAAQLLIAEEFVATVALIGLVAVAWAAVLHRDGLTAHVRPVLEGLAGSMLTFLPLAALPIYVMFRGPDRLHGTVRAQDVYVNDVLNFVLPTPLQQLKPAWTQAIVANFTGNASEWNGYIGVLLLTLLVLVAVTQWRRPVVRLASVVSATIALFSLGPHLHIGGTITRVPLLWHVARIPVLQQILPGRLMMYFYLFAGLLVAAFVAQLRASSSRIYRAGGVALIAGAALLLLPVWPYPTTITPIPSFFTTDLVNQLPDGSVAMVAPFARINYDAMEWQAASGMRFRIPEGNYLAPGPSGETIVGPWPTRLTDIMEAIYRGEQRPQLDPQLRAQLLSDLSQSGAQSVIVGPMPHQGEMISLFEELYQRQAAAQGGVYLWRGPPPAS